MPRISKVKIDQIAAFDCELRVLVFIGDGATIPHADYLKELRNGDPTLAKLGYTQPKCDRYLGARINTRIRKPEGKSRLPHGTFKPSTKVSAVVLTACTTP